MRAAEYHPCSVIALSALDRLLVEVPRKVKRQIKKVKPQLFFFFFFYSETPLHFAGLMPTFVWSDEIDCVNTECSAKVLKGKKKKRKFLVTEYGRLKIK